MVKLFRELKFEKEVQTEIETEGYKIKMVSYKKMHAKVSFVYISLKREVIVQNGAAHYHLSC